MRIGVNTGIKVLDSILNASAGFEGLDREPLQTPANRRGQKAPAPNPGHKQPAAPQFEQSPPLPAITDATLRGILPADFKPDSATLETLRRLQAEGQRQWVEAETTYGLIAARQKSLAEGLDFDALKAEHAAKRHHLKDKVRKIWMDASPACRELGEAFAAAVDTEADKIEKAERAMSARLTVEFEPSPILRIHRACAERGRLLVRKDLASPKQKLPFVNW